MSEKRLTHTQYEELGKFVDGLAHMWLYGAPSKSLTVNGWLEVARYGERRKDCSFRITESGREALMAYEARYGIRPKAVPRG